MKQATRLLYSLRAVISILLITVVYIAITVFFTNNRFLIETLASAAPLSYKLLISSELFIGMFTAFGVWQGILLLITALLVGVNITLLQKSVAILHAQGRIRLSVGGVSVLSLVTTGCSSCGVSLLSFAFPSAALVLPFHGIGIQAAGVLLLGGSLLYSLSKLSQSPVCKVPKI